MTTKEMLRRNFYKRSEKDFAMIIEDMKRNAEKGLIKESPEQIESEVEAIFALNEVYIQLDEEADEAIENFFYLDE